MSETRVRTVRDLVVALQAEDQDALVVATWESVIRVVRVYHARDGTVLVDADHGDYRSGFTSGELRQEAAAEQTLEDERDALDRART